MSLAKVAIFTYGCRMNACDTELLAALLAAAGCEFPAYEPAADVAILNCCSVREDGHTAALAKAKGLKERSPRMKVIVCGCYAKLLDEGFFPRHPEVDAIVRPEAYRQMAAAVGRLVGGEADFIVEPIPGADDLYPEVRPRPHRTVANRAIVLGKGCNQPCAYCIEPLTRGSERYATPATVLANLDTLFNRHPGGVVTLVGHMVDRYASQGVDFPRMLAMVADRCAAHGAWVKYLSSHPMTYSDATLDVVASHPNVMRTVHLPLQSGSDEVLRRMRRGYTLDQFLRAAERVLSRVPEMNIVTDVMAGFCGETDADFRRTLDAIDLLRPGDVNVYAFSMRPGTYAHAHYADDVPPEAKAERVAAARAAAAPHVRAFANQVIGQRLLLMAGGYCGWLGETVAQEAVDIANRRYVIEFGEELSPYDRECIYDEHTLIDARIGDRRPDAYPPCRDLQLFSATFDGVSSDRCHHVGINLAP